MWFGGFTPGELVMRDNDFPPGTSSPTIMTRGADEEERRAGSGFRERAAVGRWLCLSAGCVWRVFRGWFWVGFDNGLVL